MSLIGTSMSLTVRNKKKKLAGETYYYIIEDMPMIVYEREIR